ncbi:MAG TPA: ATP-binding protein, partial [Trebonia sp.]|nr:ATP-binding protein [Trebonia sp.]
MIAAGSTEAGGPEDQCGSPAPSGAPGDSGGGGPAVDHRSFPAELDSVRAARHFVTALLGRLGWLGDGTGQPLADDAAIVATELAANAVLHARSGFTLTVSWSVAAVRIAVADRAPLEPGRARPPRESEPLPVTPG